MIGEAWAMGCVDAAISLEWMQCEQIPIPRPGGGGGSSGGVEPYRKVILPPPAPSPAPARDEDVFEIELPQDYTDDELAALALAAIRVIYYS